MRTKSITLLIFAVLASLLVLQPVAQDSATADDTINTIRALNIALQNKDMDAVDALFTEKANLTFGDHDRVIGSTRARDGLIALFEQLMTYDKVDVYPIALTQNDERALTEMRIWAEPFTTANIGPVKTSQFFAVEGGKIDHVLWFSDGLPTETLVTTMHDIPITQQYLIGEWLSDAYGASIDFREDGTYSMYGFAGDIRQDVFHEGTYVVEDNLVTTYDTIEGCEITLRLFQAPGWTFVTELVSTSDTAKCGPPPNHQALWKYMLKADE